MNQAFPGTSEKEGSESIGDVSGLSSEMGAGAGFQSHPKSGWT